MTNEDIARRLRNHATELSRTGDNLYRVRAFRQAAMAVLTLPEPVERLDRSALERVPGIGRSLAGTIEQFARTGEWAPRRQPAA
jgi:DNA polymerase (family 10)